MKTALSVTVVCVLLTAPTVKAQQPPHEHKPQAAGQKPDMKMCQEMAARHQKMMEEMKAADARLDQELKAMQSAQGQAKVDAIARVVATLVEQRRDMRDRMMSMHVEASGHMMEHAGQGRDAMNQCPMMQQMMKPRAPGE